VIILDHNIPEGQARLLRRWRIHCRQIGFEVGRPEWDDQQEILRYLHSAKHATFFTRDMGFFRAKLIHKSYCIVILNVPVLETAHYIRRLLRHVDFRTRARRFRKVIKVSAERIAVLEIGRRHQIGFRW
jgi:hypothetical protein